MNRVVGRAGISMILIVALAAGMVFFLGDYLINSGDWVVSEGSPFVSVEFSGISGTVTDRNGVVLMDTSDGKVYSDDETLRSAVIHWLGDRKGSIHAPTISYYASLMTKHDVVNGLYAYGNDGGSIRLTISAAVQKAALEAMGDYKGTLAVYNYKTGQILCAVTTPTYDPDNVPDIAGDTTGAWDGAYVNRFLRSTYTPGSIFKIVTVAAALENIPDIREQTFCCEGETAYGIDKVTCLKKHGEQSLEKAFLNSCNCAFAAIADQLGGEILQKYAEKMGLTSFVRFDGVSSAAGSLSAAGEPAVMVAWSAIGQHKDLVNPCSFLTMLGAVANGGQGAMPYIVEKIDGGKWGTYQAQSQQTAAMIAPETAAVLGQMMRNNVENYYGDEHFPGLTVCAKSGTAEVGGDVNNSLLAGFVADEEYPLAFLVIVEDGSYGRQTCVPMMSKVLAACKAALDGE